MIQSTFKLLRLVNTLAFSYVMLCRHYTLPPPPPTCTIQGLGFATLMAFVLDILLAFMLLRRAGSDNPKQLSHELNLSKSSLTAVRSGKSIASVSKKSKSTKVAGVGSSSKATDPVDELSPLKNNEEVPDDDEDDLSYASL